MKNNKILVTGSSGFIGSHVADALEKKGYQVILFDTTPSKYKSKNQKEIVGNILNYSDVEKAVKNAKSGQVQYRTDKSGIVHCSIGKVEFTEDKLAENLRALITEVVKAKPSSAKGKYLKKISLSSSMGPSLLVDQASYT